MLFYSNGKYIYLTQKFTTFKYKIMSDLILFGSPLIISRETPYEMFYNKLPFVVCTDFHQRPTTLYDLDKIKHHKHLIWIIAHPILKETLEKNSLLHEFIIIEEEEPWIT